MIIICDVDEVLADMMPQVIKEYNNLYGSDITIDDIVQWELPEDMKAIYKRKDFFWELEPVEGAIEGLNMLAKNHEIIIATSPSAIPSIAYEKLTWLHCFFPEFVNNAMIGGRKELLQGDVIIDDNADYLINSPCPTKICMDRPWNRHLQERDKIDITSNGDIIPQYCYDMGDIDYRVYNWQQILDIFGGDCKIW